MILFLRGKAATGKTALSKLITVQYNYNYLSKDIFFDNLLQQGLSWQDATSKAYDQLAQAIQEAHDLNFDIVVDLGLAHTPYFKEFINKLSLNLEYVRFYLTTCSDDAIWSKRIQNRIDAPKAPNQAFKSTDEAFAHYAKHDMHLLDSEILVDSIHPLETCLYLIMNQLH